MTSPPTRRSPCARRSASSAKSRRSITTPRRRAPGRRNASRARITPRVAKPSWRNASPHSKGDSQNEEDVMQKFLLFIAALLAAGAAAAQSFPSRTLTVVVPYPPGGLIDIVARLLQPRLQVELGQNVIVENKSGAGGNVGAEAVARANPDGYTMLLANPSLGISPAMYPKLGYDPLKDLAYAGIYGTVPNVLVIGPAVPASDVKDLIAYLRKNPGRLNYASPGYGTSPQMSMELFKGMTGTFIVHIPFRGSGPAQAAMLAGETQLMFDNLPPQLPHIKPGKVRPLALTSLKRSAALPDVPTLDEAGLKSYQVHPWV